MFLPVHADCDYDDFDLDHLSSTTADTQQFEARHDDPMDYNTFENTFDAMWGDR